MDPDQLLDGLNEAQARAVQTAVVPLCILAGAGSGKTRVLTRRIAYRAATGQHDPERVLALTFTRKAAGELAQRLRALGLRDSVVAGTFHSVAYAQLRARWAERKISPPALLERKVGFVARLLPASARSNKAGPRDTLALDVTAEIEWAKARRVGAAQYPSAAKAAGRTPPLDARQIARLIDAYEAEKRKKRVVDFDDLLALCVRDLENDPKAAAAQRWRFRHFFVDEYQDVNPLQQALLDAWLGDRNDLCVVGDPNQAIYAWNGADARYLDEFTTRWQRGEVVRLTDNYRSSPEILTVANAVLGGGLAAQRASERATSQGALRANRSTGPVPSVRLLPDEKAEAAAIARAVRDRHGPGSRWSAQAVLVRTNAQTAVIEAALKAAQIPFRVKGGASLLEQPEIQQVLRDLRSARDDFSVALTDLETAAARARRRVLGASSDPLDGDEDPAADAAAGGAAAAGSIADAERLANLEALVALAHDYAAIDLSPTVAGFATWLHNTTRADQPDRQGDAVEIATFHAAKGLEWPVVHLAGLEQGYVPIGHAQSPAALAEERRLFYVAVTRAQRELLCTWAGTRTFGTKAINRERSPYLDQVVAACDALARDAVPDDWAAHFREVRTGRAPAPARRAAEATATTATMTGAARGGRGSDAATDPPPGATAATTSVGGPAAVREHVRATGHLAPVPADAPDAPGPQEVALAAALARWRAGIARGASITPGAVMHDATLRAIARTRPTTLDALTAVEGLGAVKVRRYGDAILEIVGHHATAAQPEVTR